MTNYLQRLIRTARQPAESLQPWTGSVFSPATHESHVPIEEPEERVPTASLVQPEIPVVESAEASPRPSATRNGPSSSPYTPLVSEPEPAPAHRIAAETEQHTSKKLSFVGTTAAEPVFGEAAEEFPRRRASAPGVLTTPDRTSRSSSADGAERSRLGVGPKTPARHEIFRPATGSLRAAPQTQDARSARIPRADRENDIEIHIGRIEVTAVPPPAPRAVKPPDKELSLEAYLKRREGRPR